MEGYGGLRSWLQWEARLGDAPRRLGNGDRLAKTDVELNTISIRTMEDVGQAFERLTELSSRHAQHAVPGSTRFVIDGYCAACGWGQLLVTQAKGAGMLAWRETAICRCGLNTRMRTVLDWLLNIERAGPDASIYCTEATTNFFRALKSRYPDAVGSEYIADRAAPGLADGAGVRCENVEQLSFAENAFDYVVCLEVLEHVFVYEAALRELLRVLRPGGVAIITVPFHFDRKTTVRRAALEAGVVKHLLKPIYHGDPLKTDGALLVFDYGWDFVDAMHEAGWADIAFIEVWSEPKKYLGRNFILRAVKPR